MMGIDKMGYPLVWGHQWHVYIGYAEYLSRHGQYVDAITRKLLLCLICSVLLYCWYHCWLWYGTTNHFGMLVVLLQYHSYLYRER